MRGLQSWKISGCAFLRFVWILKVLSIGKRMIDWCNGPKRFSPATCKAGLGGLNWVAQLRRLSVNDVINLFDRARVCSVLCSAEGSYLAFTGVFLVLGV